MSVEKQTIIRMESGESRMLPSESDVPRLLSMAYRDFGDGVERLSISARGLWSCTGTRKLFRAWFAGRRDYSHLRINRDYLPSKDGLDDEVYVDVVVVHFMVSSCSTDAGRVALLLVDEASKQERTSAVRMRRWRVGRGAPMLDGAFEGDHFGFGKFFAVESYVFDGRDCLGVRLRQVFDKFCGPRRRGEFSVLFRRWCRDFDLVEGIDYQTVDFGTSRPSGSTRHDFVGTLKVALRIALSFPASEPLFDHLVGCFGLGWVDKLEAQRLVELMPTVPVVPVVEVSGTVDPPAVEEIGSSSGVSGGEGAAVVDDAGADPLGDDDRVGLRRFVPAIEREIGGRTVLSVMGRDVHTFLGFTDSFSHWVSDQISRCGLQEGVDFEIEVLGGKPQNAVGRRRKEYLLTLDAAKKVGMVARGSRGNQLREHFLEAERERDALKSAASNAAQFQSVASGLSSIPPLSRSAVGLTSENAPLTLAAFLHLKGLKLPLAWSASEERSLARITVQAGQVDKVCIRLPAGGDWLFSRDALDVWWVENQQKAILADLDSDDVTGKMDEDSPWHFNRGPMVPR